MKETKEEERKSDRKEISPQLLFWRVLAVVIFQEVGL
jgi:hypothetical protein